MKRITIFFIGLIAFAFSSCKDFLDVKPSNSGDSEIAIQNPADAQVMINGVMRNLTSADYYGRNFMLYGDAKGGDFTIFARGRGLDGLYIFDHAPGAGSYSGFWAQMYNCILQTNYLLESIAKLEATGMTGFAAVKGQALTVRALVYFDLVRLYGKSYDDDRTSFGVPNIITVLPNSAQPLRATVEQNYTQILADLKAAAPLLVKTRSNGYLNYYANLSLQARVYLYMKDYVNALKSAEEVIGTNVYSLYTNANWATSWTSQFGTEAIFELGVFPVENDLTTGSLGFYHRRRSHGASTVLGWFTASDYFLNRLKEDLTDVRWSVMAADEATPAGSRLGALYKYSGSTTLVGDGKATATAVNIKVIRLSEIYLIAAEAALPTDPAKAATYLNAIRKRSPLLVPATAATISSDMILNERSKELIGEGHRFFDMIRLNKTIEFNDELGLISAPNRTKTINRGYFRTRLPIAQSELNANPGLIPQQNQGY